MSKLIFFLFLFSNICSAKVGLVLSGGGAKGLAHIGVLKSLDKSGVRVDYIVGTSMGCIIGALYSTGYSGKEIEQIVMDQNWTDLFDDKPSRKYIPMYEKDESEKYVGSFNLSSDKSFLPSGIISGQKLYELFAKLTWNYEGVKDFRKLPIPVFCVATNLENGEQVILDKGSLAESMRASMSIPTIFSPVEVDGLLLVDGGIVNNIPISEARKIGSDFIIAVDVTGPPYKKEEMDSFFRVMEQVVSLNSYKEREKEKKTADVLVDINTNKFGLANFDDAELLINIGEESIKPYLAKINKLPKKTHSVEEKKQEQTYEISSVRVVGLEKISYDLVVTSLGFHLPFKATSKDVEIAVSKIYGTQFFDSVIYDIEPSFHGEYELVLKVKERSTNILRFAFNYSSYTKASLLLNTTFKNTLGHDSRVSLDFNLSENPAFRGQYYLYSATKPGLGFRGETLFNKFNITTYENGVAQNTYRFSYYALSFNMETNFSNYMLLGIGVDKEFTTKDPTTPSQQIGKNYDEFLTMKAFVRLDTLDSVVYPKSGIKIEGEFKFATDWLSLQEGIDHKPFDTISFNSLFALPIGSRISFITNVNLGATTSNDVPYEYLFYFGGFRANYRWFMPFVGLDYMSVSGPNAFVLGGALQIELIKNFYFTVKTNVGKLANDFKDVFDFKDDLLGTGVSFGWDSPIGPIDLTLMKEIKKKIVVANISIGYWF